LQRGNALRGLMVAKALTLHRAFETIALPNIDDAKDFAARLLGSIGIARISAVDFTRFSHPPFTSCACNNTKSL
jgi:hypothetical protein